MLTVFVCVCVCVCVCFKEVQTKAVKVRKNESEINKDVLHSNIWL